MEIPLIEIITVMAINMSVNGTELRQTDAQTQEGVSKYFLCSVYS